VTNVKRHLLGDVHSDNIGTCTKSICTGAQHVISLSMTRVILKKDNRIHVADRPFSCVVCSKSFSDLTGLKQHNRSNNYVLQAASSIQRMKCKKNQHLEA
jgi:hypothetical protein